VPGINEMQNDDMSDSDNAQEERDALELKQNQKKFQNKAFG